MLNNLRRRRPPRSIKATTQFVYSFILHQLKMGFIEIYSVITLSYPWSIQNSLLLALPVNDFLRKLLLRSLPDVRVIFPLHAHPTVHVLLIPPSFTRFKFIDPIIFGNFHPGAMHRWMPTRANSPQFIHTQMNKYFYANRRP